MATTLTDINGKLVGSVSGIKMATIFSFIGWVVLVLIILGGVAWGLIWWEGRKTYSKRIRVFEKINGEYQPTGSDVARTVKLGKGGFEILYLKKRKLYRLAYGSRVGRKTYYFFIMPDGYWYNGILGGDITSDGKIPIISTSPLARAQYTALEKYVEDLYSEKKGFWDKYGNWVLSIGFILIMGVFVWLSLKEMSTGWSNFSTLTDKISELVDKVNQLLSAQCTSGSNTGGVYKVS